MSLFFLVKFKIQIQIMQFRACIQITKNDDEQYLIITNNQILAKKKNVILHLYPLLFSHLHESLLSFSFSLFSQYDLEENKNNKGNKKNNKNHLLSFFNFILFFVSKKK